MLTRVIMTQKAAAASVCRMATTISQSESEKGPRVFCKNTVHP